MSGAEGAEVLGSILGYGMIITILLPFVVFIMFIIALINIYQIKNHAWHIHKIEFQELNKAMAYIINQSGTLELNTSLSVQELKKLNKNIESLNNLGIEMPRKGR